VLDLKPKDKNKNKIDALYEPQVCCIAKGKSANNMSTAAKFQLPAQQKAILSLVS